MNEALEPAGDLTKITIATRKPDKWRFVDCETGEVWRYDPERRTFVRDRNMTYLDAGMTPAPPEEGVPDEIKEIVDRAAGRVHSAEGSVMTCLAEVLAAHRKMLLG